MERFERISKYVHFPLGQWFARSRLGICRSANVDRISASPWPFYVQVVPLKLVLIPGFRSLHGFEEQLRGVVVFLLVVQIAGCSAPSKSGAR